MPAGVLPPSGSYNIDVSREVTPDPNFLQFLRFRPSAAFAVLHSDFIKESKTLDDRIQILRRLFSVIAICVMDVKSTVIVHDPKLQEVLMGILHRGSSYDVRPAPEIAHPTVDLEGEIPFDYVSITTVMAALYLYGATHIVYLDKYRDPSIRESLRAGELRLLRQVQQFWRALLENRAIFFRPSVLNQILQFSNKATPLQIRCILADCLLKIADLLERFHREPPVDDNAMKVYFLTWIHIAPSDLKRQDEITRRFHILFQARQGRSNDWFRDVLVTSQQKADFVAAFRSNMLRHKIDDRVHARLLNVFYVLCNLPELRECLYTAGSKLLPVFWIMKALQRQLCMNAGSPNESFALLMGISSMSNWCNAHSLNPLWIAHDKIGVPLLPYIGRLGLSAFDYPDAQPYEVYGQMTNFITTWLASNRSTYVPLLRSSAVRREWIRTLRAFRARASVRFASNIINLWLEVGAAHGLSEEAETAWLVSDEAKRPSSEACPWDHCGWSGCMCYDQKPLFKLSECTGCERAYYCGKTCQKKAWKEGHKDTCSRKRTRR